MPDFRSIISDIKKGKFAPVYILMGEESYYIDRIVEELDKHVIAEEDKEFDQTVFYGSDTSADVVKEALGRFPLMAEKHYVSLKESQAMHKAKTQLDKLASYVANPSGTTVFVLSYKGESLKASSALIKAAKKNESIIVFDSPKVKDYQLGGIVKDYCRGKKIKIDDQAVELLVANVGSSLSNMFSEIEKLMVAYKGKNDTITADMIHEHIGVSKAFNNFELIKALSKRDYFQSLRIIKHFEDNPKTNPSMATCTLLFKYFQQLVLASFSQDRSDSWMMKALQLKTRYAIPDIKTGLAHYNASQLVQAIHAIREFDTKAKGVNSFQKEYPLLRELVLRILTL